MDSLSLLGLIALGLCSGGVTGLIGSSGVLIVVPALTLLFGLPIHTAIGTSLAVDVIASIIVSIVYYRMGNVELRSGLGLALGAVVGAQVGSRIAKYIPSANLGRGFGIFLVIIG
ncbi:sulfite exporter TauE/SafE family protein, partial [Thermofilum sp.]